MNAVRANPRRQRGAALLVGLLVLIVMTLIGVTAMETTILQEQMTGGMRNSQLAEQASESALRRGEQFLWGWFENSAGVKLVGDQNGTLGVYSAAPDNPTVQTIRADRNMNSYGFAHDFDFTSVPSGAPESGKLAALPRYVIEELTPAGIASGGLGAEFDGGGAYSTGGSAGELIYYRVTARATDGTGNVTKVHESTYTLSR